MLKLKHILSKRMHLLMPMTGNVMPRLFGGEYLNNLSKLLHDASKRLITQLQLLFPCCLELSMKSKKKHFQCYISLIHHTQIQCLLCKHTLDWIDPEKEKWIGIEQLLWRWKKKKKKSWDFLQRLLEDASVKMLKWGSTWRWQTLDVKFVAIFPRRWCGNVKLVSICENLHSSGLQGSSFLCSK